MEWAHVDYSQNPPVVPDDDTQVKYMQPATFLFDEKRNVSPMGKAYAAL